MFLQKSKKFITYIMQPKIKNHTKYYEMYLFIEGFK
jgi:hypothetical protein